MKELLTRTITGVGLVGLVAGSILLGPEAFALVLLAIYILGVHELYHLYHRIKTSFRWPQGIPGGLLIVVTYLVIYREVSTLWFLVPVAMWPLSILRGGFNFPGMLSFLWLAIPLSCILGLGWTAEAGGYSYMVPLSLMIMIWLNDTLAYLTGSLIGRHKLTPVLSPGKTWEGFIGGFLFTLFLAWVAERISNIYPLSVWLIIAVVVSVMGLIGDLFESGLKRSLKVKDSGKLLPGHGGILDRFDSLFFVSPLVFLLLVLYTLLIL